MKEHKKQLGRSGFTMVELMAVLIILGLLAGVVVKNFVGQVDKGKKTTTRANLRLLHSAVNQFYMDNGRYPTEDEGLYALIEQPMDVENWPTGGYRIRPTSQRTVGTGISSTSCIRRAASRS